MKRVLVVISAFGLGGITSFAIPLINYLCEINYDVTVLYGRDEANYISRLNKKVKFEKFEKPPLGKVVAKMILKGKLFDILRIKFKNSQKSKHISALQHLGYCTASMMPVFEKEYDIAISTSEFFGNAYIANKIRATKKIGWVHPNLETLNIDVEKAKAVAFKLDKIVAVSKAGCDYLKSIIPEKSEHILHIDNMLDKHFISKAAEEPLEDFFDLSEDIIRIVSVCRIDNVSKRVDRMIKSAKIMYDKKFKFKWYVLGDGANFYEMKELAKQLGVDDSIILTGAKINPYPYVKQADLFILTSQYEGKPIVVEEAKFLNVPVITTEYGSAKEQLVNYGAYIVENKDEICEEQIANAIMDKNLLQQMKNVAQNFVYSNEASQTEINNLLKNKTV